ncbi:MAG: hypothetical protein AAF519_20160 [Bacteroidota bacterium]
MNKILIIFKYIAYLNIPLMLGALYFVYAPIFDGALSGTVENMPKALLLMGFALSFTSLRDVKKIDKMGRYVIERPALLKAMVYQVIILSVVVLLYGAYLLIFTTNDSQLGVGLMSFGVGFVALAKSLVDQAKDLTDLYD